MPGLGGGRHGERHAPMSDNSRALVVIREIGSEGVRSPASRSAAASEFGGRSTAAVGVTATRTLASGAYSAIRASGASVASGSRYRVMLG